MSNAKIIERYIDPVPSDATYNNGVSSPLGDYEEIKKTDKDARVLSWSTRYMLLWDMILTHDRIKTITPAPPLYIDRRDNTPRCHVKTDKESYDQSVIGHMIESWNWGSDDDGFPIAGRIYYQLRIYEKAALEELHDLCGDRPTIFAASASIDRLLFHELSHFIRNTDLWSSAYDNNDPRSYEECMDDIHARLADMGGKEDEKNTEAMALQLLRERYFFCASHALVPTANSPWIAHRVKQVEKKSPGYGDAKLVCDYYQLRWEIDFCDLSEREEQKKINEMKRISKELKKHGKEYGVKFRMVQ